LLRRFNSVFPRRPVTARSCAAGSVYAAPAPSSARGKRAVAK
jgi:hypothetical protein